MASPLPDFVRRCNQDGTTDSICTKCFVTVATATWEADLASAEQRHKCDSSRIENLRKSVKSANRSDETGESTERSAFRQVLVS